jgi:hypothetical protein
VPFLILFLIGNRQVIFNRRDETVYISYGFGRWKLVRFSDILQIKLVTGITSVSFRIILKKNKYGKGINLLSPVAPKAMQAFDTIIMPALKEMITLSKTEKQPVINIPETDEPTVIDFSETEEPPVIDLDRLKYYTRKGNLFTLIRRYEIGWNIFLLCVCIVGIRYGITSANTTLIYCIIPPILVVTGLLTHTRKFDTDNGIFTHTIAFVWKKSYRFEQFSHYAIVRNITNGFYNGTDVKLVFVNDKGKEETVKLLSLYKTGKIEQFKQETTAIMIK